MATVLLGMDDNTADIFRESLEQYSDNELDILNQNVPIFHNAQRALEIIKPKPDIFLISVGHIRFDEPDKHKELLKGLASLKMNSKTSNIRIAVQIDTKPNDSFLRKLALIQITDIFPGTNQNPQEFNMAAMAKQLSVPANLKNVYRYLSLNQSVDGLDVLDGATSNLNARYSDDGRVKQLEKLVKVMKQQRDDLQKKVGLNTVPRQDYDEVIAELNNIMSSGLTNDKFSQLWKKLIKIEEKQKHDIAHVNSINEKLNNSIVDLNNQLSSTESSVDNAEVQRLRDENNRLKRNIKESANYQRPKAQPVYTKERSSPRKTKPQKASSGNGGVRKVVIGLLAFLVIGGVGVGVIKGFAQNNQPQTQQSNKPAFSDLIKSGEYAKAAAYYPKKAVQAENAMMSDKNLTAKGTMAERISKYSNNDVIKFDLSYFNADYENAVEIYRNSSEPDLTNLSKERRVMAAYSLMKTGNISDAKQTAKPLNNENLDKRIKIYSKFYNANKILTNKINNGDLSRKEIEKAKKQIKENQEAMDKL